MFSVASSSPSSRGLSSRRRKLNRCGVASNDITNQNSTCFRAETKQTDKPRVHSFHPPYKEPVRKTNKKTTHLPVLAGSTVREVLRKLKMGSRVRISFGGWMDVGLSTMRSKGKCLILHERPHSFP
jgi:hypothetical protein